VPKIPGINHLDAIRALQRAGFVIERQGKHIVMRKGGHRLIIPGAHPINAFTMGGIARDPGLTPDQFTALL
jgi:predicted RNA binding protein YcfA (HicA-like mRNA interferase family)